MESPRPDRFPDPTPASCSTGCRYAEPLSGDYADWIWCTRPGAAVRVRQLASECPWVHPEAGSGESAGPDDGP